RPAAQLRNRSTASPAVTATGTMFSAASTRGTSSSAARRQHALTSAGVQSRSRGVGWPGSRPYFSRYIRQIAWRCSDPGKSRKNVPSNLSLRANSGGNLEISLLVQTTNESLALSLSQESIVPNSRAETPESPDDPEEPASAFSTS